jgi:Ni,Fe-hydrogenase III large subunit
MTAPPAGNRLPAAPSLAESVAARVAAGVRFAGLSGTAWPASPGTPQSTGIPGGHGTSYLRQISPDPAAPPHRGQPETGALLLTAYLAAGGELDTVEAVVPAGATGYPAVTPRLGAAFWYERAVHDLFGVIPQGHPRLEPLTLPLGPGAARRPRPGEPGPVGRLEPDEHVLARHVAGKGMFTIPHGPVRSGVVESIEYLVETPGEDIPHLNMRLFYKHRGIEKRFEGMTAADGVLLAERAEGTCSVAHALAYSHAVERIAGCEPPRPARLVRVLHAELERVANHLDVAARLADAAGLAVATARFGRHKERVLRLTGQLCGSRYGRGVVIPGGVTALPGLGAADILAEAGVLERDIAADSALLMSTASFLDRLRRTGPLSQERAREHGALGPVGRASAAGEDVRRTRPYDGYPGLGLLPGEPHAAGDALARLRVRWQEVAESFHLIRQATGELAGTADEALATACPAVAGRAVGWAEAPQGEVLYDVRAEGGRIVRCWPRSASFHNLVLFHEVFAGDILTDFPFIEASFGLCVAGVAL